MISIPCPNCGSRNADEFRHTGEARPRPEPSSTTPEQWRSYLYTRSNVRGWTTESWYHASGCRRFFELERNTATNEIRMPEVGSREREAR